jgi:hypothetical protein
MRAIVIMAMVSACSGNTPCDIDEPGTICTIAGTGEQAFNGDGPALRTDIYIPMDVAVAPNGEVWFLDFNNYLVRAIDEHGNVRTVVGNGLVGDSPAPGVAMIPAREATFNHTTDLVFHDGYLYLAAWHNSRVKRVRLADMMLENFAGAGKRSYYDGNGGPALDAAFDLPVSIAFDARGNAAIMDQANQVVRRVDARGIVDAIAGRCIVDAEQACAPGQQPVACPGSNKLTCGGDCASNCGQSFSGDGGAPLDARMAQPVGQVEPGGGIAYDHQGCLIFADTLNHRIRRIDPAGTMTTIATDVDYPFDIEVAADDSIYFADVKSHCIRKIDPSGTLSTVAGRCGERGFAGDGGAAADALLDRPYGIAVTGDRLYIADSYNNRVRAVRLR